MAARPRTTGLAHPHGLRQIHLDFHTSRDFDSVARHFDAGEFARTMHEADVSSVNVFAKCHHGFSYYPTDVGTTHPGVTRDLLGEQIAALHARGIHAPIYVSVLWDDLAGELHPEWVVTGSNGRQSIRTPLSADSPLKNQRGWTTMDIASGYGDFVISQLGELIDRYPVDGFWLDIVWVETNYSPAAQARLRAAGVPMSEPDAVYASARASLLAWMDRVAELMARRAPAASVFFNGMVDATASQSSRAQTHLEVESLPTSGGVWGYMHYPVASRYARTLGKPMIGMTGRFHRSWADFGGLKPSPQLDFECGTILAAGAGVSVGDQLDPDGVADPAVYQRIGQAFGKIRSLEPWLVGAQPLADVAVLVQSQLSYEGVHVESTFSSDVEGAALVFLELGVQFDIVDPLRTDLADYAAILIPDGYRVDASVAAVIAAARAAGTKLILSPTAALDTESGEFDLDVPVTYSGPAPTVPGYVVAGDLATGALEVDTTYPYVIYGPAHIVAPGEGAVGHGRVLAARFNRTWEHFTSHSHAPVGDDLDAPLAVVSDDVLYLSAPLFSLYREANYWVYQRLVRSLLGRFLPDLVVQAVSSSQVEVSVHELPESAGERRFVVHLVPFAARRSFSAVPRMDDPIRFADVEVSLKLGAEFVAARRVPDGAPVPGHLTDGIVALAVGDVIGHTVIEVTTRR